MPLRTANNVIAPYVQIKLSLLNLGVHRIQNFAIRPDLDPNPTITRNWIDCLPSFVTEVLLE